MVQIEVIEVGLGACATRVHVNLQFPALRFRHFAGTSMRISHTPPRPSSFYRTLN